MCPKGQRLVALLDMVKSGMSEPQPSSNGSRCHGIPV